MILAERVMWRCGVGRYGPYIVGGLLGVVLIVVDLWYPGWGWVVPVGTIVLLFGGGVVWAAWVTVLSSRRMEKLPPAAPTLCPACGGTDHEFKSGGLWDGEDLASGKSVGGSFSYGRCNGCGTRWGKWDDAPVYVVSDDEWEREVGRFEKEREEQLAKWTEHRARRAGEAIGR